MSNAKLVKSPSPFWTLDKIYILVKIYSILTGILCVLTNRLLCIPSILFLIGFIGLCVLYIRYPEKFTLSQRLKKSEKKISLVYIFLLDSLLFLFCCIYKFNLIAWGKLCVFALILFGILFVLFLKLTKEYKTCRHMHWGVAVYLFLMSFCLIPQMNYIFDFRKPEKECAIVIEKEMQFNTGRSTGIGSKKITWWMDFLPFVKVTVQMESGETKNLYTTIDMMSAIEQDKDVMVVTHKGAFGIAYQSIDK